jgi:hypothetical protein
MEVCKLPLVRAQMDSVVKAVMIRGISVDQFISEAISEKLTRTPGTSARPEAVSPNGAVTVLLFDRDKEEEIEQFDLKNAEFSRIRDAIAKTVDRPVDGAAVAAFVRKSLLHSTNRELLPGYSPTDLEKLGLVHPSTLTSGEIQIAVQVLVDLAVRKVQDCPIDEQICVWNALSKTLPDSAAREHARNIALLQSKVAAFHLQFADTLSSQAAQPSPQRRAA